MKRIGFREKRSKWQGFTLALCICILTILCIGCGGGGGGGGTDTPTATANYTIDYSHLTYRNFETAANNTSLKLKKDSL